MGNLHCWKDKSEWAEEPFPGATLERRNNDRGYSPDNCYWADRKVQARNRSTNRTVAGVSLAEASEKCGVRYATLLRRLDLGWSVARAMSTPVKRAS